MNGRHSALARQVRRTPWTAVAVLVLAVATGVVASGYLRDLGVGRDHTVVTTTGSTSTPRARPPTDPCRAVRARQTAALAKAQEVVRHWRVHIEEMEELAEGHMVMPDANRSWDLVRDSARRTMQAFAQTDATYRDAFARAGGCRGAFAAGDAVLTEARGTVAQWGAHIRDMDDLRNGRPTTVMTDWIEAYAAAEVRLARYDAARSVYLATLREDRSQSSPSTGRTSGTKP